MVGGAGSLEIAPGVRLVDSPGFPEEYKAESLSQADALSAYRARAGNVDWTYISPAAEIGPGTRTGHYRTGDNALLVDARAKASSPYEDFAKAILDEIEHPTHPRARMTVAY